MHTRRHFFSYGLALMCADHCVSLAIAADLPQVIAFELDAAGRPLIPVFVNGSGPFRFVLDTGASHSVISSQLAKQLALKPGASMQVNSSTGQTLAPNVTVEQFEIGSLRFEHQQLPVVDSQLLSAAGILGVDALAQKKVEIDFRSKKLFITSSLGKPTLMAGADLHALVPAKKQLGGILLINAEVQGVTCEALVDTGAQRTIGNQALLNKLSELTKQLQTNGDAIVLTTPSGATMAATVLPALAISMSNVTVRGNVVFTDAALLTTLGLADKPALLIGMDVLGTLSSLAIDYGESTVLMR